MLNWQPLNGSIGLTKLAFIVRLVMCRLLSLRDDTMRALMSQTKLPDSSNPLSDIVGAVHNLLIRSAHAIGFEGGLVLICLPLYMIWYDVGLIKAFMMEAALLLFFLVYTFVFTLGFDKIFTLPRYDKSASASS